MTTHTPNKLNVNMPARYERGLRAAASARTAVTAGFTDGSLAERWKR